MVKGKTKSGIKFSMNEKVKEDARLLFYLVKIEDEETSDLDKGKYVFKLLELFFGADGVPVFMEEVAGKHDGICDTVSMMTELHEILEALGVKNS